MNIDLPSQYDPKAVESAIYKKWLDAGAFHAVPDERPPEQRFSVVIPPPNVTGALHLGHAINGTIQDILVRYHRMRGDNTLWMPGIDHAGIATQAVVEKTIFEKEKKNRHDLGRDELVRRIWEWKEKFGDRILTQLQSIGSSCDWERTRFTLDDVCARAVREAFFKMFKDGLIFRGKRLVNWDTHLQTAVADDEIYHETVRGQMTSIKYPVEKLEARSQEPEEYLIVATTRPETMLGDTAVAVHPDDPRYKHLIGKHVIVPLVGRRIPIVGDGLLVDPKFGTGVVKVTPAHDPNDYATGVRHGLEQINLLTADGKVNENGRGSFAGKEYNYTGLKFATAARKQVLADLESLGLIAEAKPHEHEVGHSDRSKTPIEPFLSDQWFVRMGDIASETRPSGSVERETNAQQPDAPVQTLPYGRVTDGPTADVPPVQAHSKAVAYFITFRTYGSWLHGDEKGAVDPGHNAYGEPFMPPDARLLARDQNNLTHPPLEFTTEQRQQIYRTLREVAEHRGWRIHALNVRATHVHVVVGGSHSPERMMNDFKSWATRRLVEAALLPPQIKAWSRHGSTRYLWKPIDVASAVQYSLHEQGDNIPGTSSARSEGEPGFVRMGDIASETRPSGSVERETDAQQLNAPDRTLPHGRVTDGIILADGTHASGLAQAAMDAVTDGRVKITPERYAKGYLDWLGQKRDWCISRQLWWGHRIPVWRLPESVGIPLDRDFWDRLDILGDWIAENRVAANFGGLIKLSDEGGLVFPIGTNNDEFFISVRNENDSDVVSAIEAFGFVRDPDVLDTWFSSALWPISTMGWPERGTSSAANDQLLPYFYPTSVLSTAREILTLWVARMVMFGLYCHGDVPFKNVYIHAVIQDGEGRPMKKSLGNGVDPVDIVASHGADALRFTLASMATETQDIRMPVVKDAKTGVNTSPKFDIGRNFANKIWNASRFILSNIEEKPEAGSRKPEALEDRWILSRLNATITSTTAAINEYRFADLANGLYQFFWSDLCDWYLEISKSRIKSGDATVQSILLHCLRTSLQLLHPMMPFITEEIWSKLPHIAPGLPGETAPMLITGPFPQSNPALSDAEAVAQIELAQDITSEIRNIRNEKTIPSSKQLHVTVRPLNELNQQWIKNSRIIIESMTNAILLEISLDARKPENAATAVLPEVEIYVAGVIDRATETTKLTKRRDELNKFIAGNKAKLSNEAFTAKAPEKIVQGLRDQMQQQEAELAAVEKNLTELS